MHGRSRSLLPLLAVLLMAALSACGGADEPDDTTQVATEPVATTEPVPTPEPTATEVAPTATPEPEATATAVPATPTAAPEPSATPEPEPTTEAAPTEAAEPTAEAAPTEAAEPTAEAAPTEPAPAAVDGAAVFSANCAFCHGPSGGGTGRAPSLTGIGQFFAADPTPLANLVTNGGTQMPEFGSKLSSEQIQAVVQYVVATFQ